MNRHERYVEKNKHPCADCPARVCKGSVRCKRCSRLLKSRQLHEKPLRFRHGYAKRDAAGRLRPEYYIWMSMKARCMNPKAQEYENYGGRGITVCARWLGKLGFDNFLADMGDRPAGKMPSGRTLYTIDRKNNNGPYSPQNCCWATYAEQGNRRTTSRLLTHGGRTMTMSEWAREIGVDVRVIHNRLGRAGWTVERALTPIQGAS